VERCGDIDGKKEGLSILREPKSEFERMTLFVIIDSVSSKVD
jgi:hypothetical protein